MKLLYGIGFAALASAGFFVGAIVEQRSAPKEVSRKEASPVSFSGSSPYVRCRELRAEFFKRCMRHQSDDETLTEMIRTTCEVHWSQLHGHVFDGDPRSTLTEEKDCSGEF